MMGLPDGWVTAVPDLTRNEQLKALGNGVVPQQGLAAYAALLDLDVSAVTQSEQSRDGKLLPTPRATDGTKGGPNQRGSSGDLMLPSAAVRIGVPESSISASGHLLPTPRAAANRTSHAKATAITSRSAPSLEQATEIARGELSREFTSWDVLPPSWRIGQVEEVEQVVQAEQVEENSA